MQISEITAEAFNSSIEIALCHVPDLGKSLQKIQKTINGLPDGRVFTSVRGNNAFFYAVVNGKQRYISKKSNLLYALLRRRYLTELSCLLQLSGSDSPKDQKRFVSLLARLQKFIRICEMGNLDIARIVLTSRQYKWFTGQFRQKSIDLSSAFFTASGLPVRSKSERDIANACESLAVPFHYEEQIQIYAHDLVMRLEEQLKQENKLRGPVYSFRGSGVYWNVPPELEWMNARGSIWKSYYPPSGKITIHNDFKIMLANDEVIIWEHEGLMEDFVYRRNATERAAIMKYTGTISKGNLIETYEHEIDTPEKLAVIIEEHILPRLWF